jgi:Zn-dependent protease
MAILENWDEEKLKRLKKQLLFALGSFLFYCILGWKVAVLITIGVAFHETGHIWAAHRMGLKTKGFYLIPLLGGAAIIDDAYDTYWKQAFTVLMGPIWGGTLAFGCGLMYWLTGSMAWAGAAQWLAWMNMFNLLPLAFLDGGQILDTVTYSFSRRVGLICRTVSIAVAVPVVWTFNPVISALIAFSSFFSLQSEYKNYQLFQAGHLYKTDEEYRNKPKALNKSQLTITLVTYVIALVSLFWLSTTMHSVGSGDWLSMIRPK